MGATSPEGIIAGIRRGLDASKGTRIWPEFVRALNLISQVVFTRSAGFVLELVQNAEDAGRCVTEPGFFEVSVNPKRVKITHNGRPFDESDVEALCGIRSSKKPAEGTLGYLGIGFKSVFKVTDAPEIYSGGFRFKFDKRDPAWSADPDSAPWHVSPIWLQAPSEPVDPALTTFILPFRESAAYKDLVAELRRLDTGLFLFLRWLKKVRMVNEETGDERTLENLGEDGEGITTLRQGKRLQRFKVFRKSVSVPARVADEDLTRAYRKGVRQREIAIAFAVGPQGDLDAAGSTSTSCGVYSFMPLGEVNSGARFRIQADFLVQPGRDALNHEARWNQWLVQEVASLSAEALSCLSDHPRWRYQFLPLFEFSRIPGDEAHDILFGPFMIDRLEKEVREQPCLPAMGGTRAGLNSVVMLAEDANAAEALIEGAVLRQEEVAEILGGQPGLAVLDPRVVPPRTTRIPQVSRWNLLRNREFLEKKAVSPDGPEWFRRLYLWLHSHHWHDTLPDGCRARQERRYHSEEIVLAADGKLYCGGEVLLPSGMFRSPLLSDLCQQATESRPICHPLLVDAAGQPGEAGRLVGFLTGKCGVQKLDDARICKDWVLPMIRADAPKPDVELLVQYTRVCMETLTVPPGAGTELWVLSKDGEIRPAKEVLFSAEYKAPQCWERLARYLPRAAFLDPVYFKDSEDPVDLAGWRAFFVSGGIKPAPSNGIEEVAMNVAEEMLSHVYARVSRVHMRNLGYDLEVETRDGRVLRVEVKGLGSDGDVELTPNETQTADHYQEEYALCVVAPIPASPHLHVILNPTAPGRGAKYSLKVPSTVWREARWPPQVSPNADTPEEGEW